MVTKRRLFTHGLFTAMVVALAMAAALYVWAGGAGPTAEAQSAGDIVQVTPEDGDHSNPALLEVVGPGTTTR